MNISDRLELLIKEKKRDIVENSVRGSWLNIRICPDLLAGEILNIGVAFLDRNGKAHVKLLDDASPLEHIFGKKINREIINLIFYELSEKISENGANLDVIKKISPNVFLSEKNYAAGASVDSILDSFFNQTVFLNKLKYSEKMQKKEERISGMTNISLKKNLVAWVESKDSSLAREIFPSNPKFRIKLNDAQQSLRGIDLPIRNPGKLAGGIVSANGSFRVAELRLLQSAMHMQAAKNHLTHEKIGMFILRPEHKKIEDQNKLDDIIDESVWPLIDAGISINSENTIEMLGSKLLDWVA